MKEIIYNITQQTEGRKVAITGVNEPVNKSNVLGIINKTQSKVLYTPLQYANLISSEWSSLDGGTLTLILADNVQIINVGDILFVKLYLDKDIDFSALAKEDTLTQGISSVESKVDEVGNKIDNIDLTPIESKVDEGVSTLSSKIDNIDLSAVENKVQEESAAIQAKIGNIKFPEIDTTELAKETTLNTVSSKLDNLNVEVDLSSVSKQGENQEATNTAIYDTLNYIKDDVIDIVQSQLTEVDNLLDF